MKIVSAFSEGFKKLIVCVERDDGKKTAFRVTVPPLCEQQVSKFMENQPRS